MQCVAMIFACVGLLTAPRVDDQPTLPDGGRARANCFIRLAVPGATGEDAVVVDIVDPYGRRVWTGATRDNTVQVFTRDWRDGQYTVRFSNGRQQSINIDSALFGAVQARCGLMLRMIEPKRDADGLPPREFAGASNLLQRLMTEMVWRLPDDHLGGNLYHCEQQLGIRTATVNVRILGSGSSDYVGYDGPYRRFHRERTMMFMPPDVAVDFAAHAERKLERWGYDVEDIAHVLITHEHADHFDAPAIAAFAGKRIDAGLPKLTVHSGPTVSRLLREYLESQGVTDTVGIAELRPGVEADVGELRVRPVPATHEAGPVPLCYIMRWHGAAVYYGTDTGFPSGEALSMLQSERFDVFGHELTVASADDGVTHTDLGDFVRLIDKLRSAGAVDAWTRIVTLHNSPQGVQLLPDYNHWQRMAGFEVSHDGMVLPIAYVKQE